MAPSDLAHVLDAAFPLEPRSAFTLHQGVLAAQEVIREIPASEWQDAARLDQDRGWRSYSDDELMACEAALEHLPDDAFVYYLPAFLGFAVRHLAAAWPQPAWHAVGAVVFSITNRSPFNRARLQRLAPPQREAVVRFLEVVAQGPNNAHAADAERALTRYGR